MPAPIQGLNFGARPTARSAVIPAAAAAARARPRYPGAIFRDQVQPGQIFAKVIKGRMGTKRYGTVGKNGTLYSVNMNNGNVAISKKPNGEVIVTGSYSISVEKWPTNEHRPMARRLLPSNAAFVVASKVKSDYGAGKNEYVNLGFVQETRKYLGINSVSRDNSTTDDGNKTVVQTGAWMLVPRNSR